MDGQKDRLEEDRKHIWLRYATEFTSGGRKHTIEMGVPMPLGASDEERERLLHEAELGMQQLIGRVEKRATQAFQRVQNSIGAGAAQGQQAAPRLAQPPQKPASVPAPQTSTQQPLKAPPARENQVRESAPPHIQAEEVQVPPSRSGIGPLPSTPTATSELDSGDMQLSAFLHYIKEMWNIEPREAMHYLNVRSLSTINRRAAVARLHELLDKGEKEGRQIGSQPTNHSTPTSIRSSNRPYTAPSADTQPPQVQNRAQVTRSEGKIPPSASNAARDTVADQPTRPVVAASATRDLPIEAENGNGHRNVTRLAEALPQVSVRPVRAFDEEDGPEDLEGLVDLEEGEQNGVDPAFIHIAQDKLHQLREIKGPTVVREHRLKVLGNVIGDQISEEELQKLIEGVWGVTVLKKLKLDQNEALITWAKEDDFVLEAKAVLHLLEEEQ